MQAQDRCHRIGQTREVHIYRLISEHTIEENILRKSDQKRHLDFLAIQSGGFTTDILNGSLLNTSHESDRELPDSGTADALQAAMRAAEDEKDAEAATAAEKETAAEMEEFTREAPTSTALSDDEKTKETGESEASEGFTKQTEATEDDEVMNEVEKLAHVEEPGGDPLKALDKALRPIERYAVRYLENYSTKIDKDALTAEMEATYKVENFDINAIEEAEKQRVSFKT